jgi:hypothetical protein
MDGVGFVALRKDGMFRRPAFERFARPGSVRNRWALNPLRGFRAMYHPSMRGKAEPRGLFYHRVWDRLVQHKPLP